MEQVAARKGCTPGQLALAWLHAQGEDVFPIPGAQLLSLSSRASRSEQHERSPLVSGASRTLAGSFCRASMLSRMCSAKQTDAAFDEAVANARHAACFETLASRH